MPWFLTATEMVGRQVHGGGEGASARDAPLSATLRGRGWGYCTLAKLMQIAGGSNLDVKLGRVDSLVMRNLPSPGGIGTWCQQCVMPTRRCF